MSGEHFKELIGTVSLTSGLSKRKISSLIGVTPKTIWDWEHKGVPVRIKPYVMSVLRSLVFKDEIRELK